jgi:pyridoxamine 5'-phosphate oxidase-like protein
MGGEPQQIRPVMPAGYGVPESDEGILDWSWAVERLETARNYWFSTTRKDGRPHVMPAWAVWLDGELYFDGSPLTRRSQPGCESGSRGAPRERR